MKIKKFEKLVTNLHDKAKYVIHMKNLNQALSHGLILKNIHRVIECNEKTWLKPYIDMNTKLKKIAKNSFEKDVLMNNAVSGKSKENVRKQRNIKLVTTERRRNYLVWEQNHNTTNIFTKKILEIDMRKNSNTYE